MKRILIIFLSVLMLNGCSKPVDNTEKPLPVDQLENDDLIVEINEEDIEQEEVKLDDEMTIEIEPLSTPDPTKSPEIAITSKPTKEPEKVPNNTPQPTKQPNVTPKPVVTVEPTVEPIPEVTITPSPTPIPTPVPTLVPTPVSTPEPPKQVCPGGYNPDWDCGVRIDKGTPIKLFSVADYGSVEAENELAALTKRLSEACENNESNDTFLDIKTELSICSLELAKCKFLNDQINNTKEALNLTSISLKEYRDDLVKLYIRSIQVTNKGNLIIQFKSGLEVTVSCKCTLAS